MTLPTASVRGTTQHRAPYAGDYRGPSAIDESDEGYVLTFEQALTAVCTIKGGTGCF